MTTRRRVLLGSGGLIALATAGAAGAETPTRITGRNATMEIKRSGSQPSGKGPAGYFTGAVRVDPMFQAPDPARVVGASVTFEPGERTAWHTHPLSSPGPLQMMPNVPQVNQLSVLKLVLAPSRARPPVA